MAGRGPRVGTESRGGADPCVIAPFTDRSSLSLLRLAKKRGLSLLEARVDLFANLERESVIAHVGRARAVAPVLATVRSAEEGGKWKLGEPERLALYRAL